MNKWIADIIFISFMFALVMVIVLIATCVAYNDTPSPVEEMNKVKSLTASNDSIKIIINELDSVKYAKIIEVQTLGTDSTVKLFYELVEE